jgi:hypothetical protein
MVVALAVAVAVDAAGASRALAAGTGREPLHGHQGIVPPGATLIGPAPSTTTLPLVVTLQPRDPAALSAEVQAVSDPRSPQYRHFLTPAEFARRFGATPSSVAQVASALRSQGLSVGTPSATGLSLPVSGTVAQVQSAFSTPISRYRLSSGKTGFDNGSAPEVPVAVAPQIEGILGLDTLSPPQPSTTVPQASSASPHPATSGAAPTVSGQPTPTCSGLSEAQTSYPGALDADQLAQAYSFDPLYAANHYGAGATVALLEMAGAGFSSSDISTFAACYGIPFTPGDGQITQKDVDGGGAEGPGTVESELDIEDVLSLAPQANIEVYEGEQSMYDVFSQIVSDHTAKIVSASWTNGCEAYVGQSYQNSENTLFQAAAIEGQSIFVASGDEGSEGCNVNGVSEAKTGTDPVAQAVDPSTGTLYIANKSSNTVSVDSEGSTSDPSNFANAFSVPTGSGPDAVALDSSAGEVFVANSGSSTLTEFSTTTCNQTTTSGCSSPTSILSGGNLNAPDSLVVNGSTLYVGNNNGKVAVYNITTNQFVATVTLASSSHPTALAVDAANGFVYVADGSNSRIEYFNATTCNATTFTTCSATPLTVPVGVDPVALAVASAGGDLYVGNAGTGGGITVVSLATHAVVKTISTTQPSNVTGLVQSIGMSPNNQEVLAVLTGPSPSGSSPYFFPGDVMATVNTSTRSISATVSLQNGWDPMGQLVSDGTRDDVWALDESSGSDEGDLVQNLNLGVSDPASQPYVTAVGGTSVTSVGPPAPTETVWNDQLNYSEGAGGGGISQTFSMPAYQQPLGTVSGSSGTPCAASSGDCREVPDVSADADPSTGYFIYDSVNGLDWDVLGGTSGAAPLWAAVLAVDASADGNTAGYGALDPALYLLAQQSAGTYLNDVTTGNNDYNATDGGSYPAMAGYDMATGLGTPVASQLAIGLTGIPLDVVVSGTQAYEGTPSFTASANYAGSGSAPFGVTLNTSGLACTEVGTSTTITPTLPLGTDTLVASSCSGLTLSGVDAGDYAVVYTTDANDFTVNPGPVDVAVSGTQSFGGTPIFAGTDSPPPGITVSTTGLTCTKVGVLSLQPIAPTLAAGNYALSPSSCSGAALAGTNTGDYTLVYTGSPSDFTVTPALLTVTASSGSMNYGAAPPVITPGYFGFVNGNTPSSLTTPPTCSTAATSSSPVSGSPYLSSCAGAVDSNYSFSYLDGSVTVSPVPLTITASSPAMTYGGTVPAITAGYAGFVNGDTASSLSAKPTCSTTATGSDPVSPPTYPSSCSGAADPNYTIGYVGGSVTINRASLTITASSPAMTYGGTVPAITPGYAGFVNGDSASALTTPPTCSTTASGSDPASPPTYPSSCSGAADPNYTIGYVGGSVTIDKAPLTVTASSPAMTYGGTVPAITPGYAGFVNGDSASSLSAKPTCSTTATSSSPASPPAYTSSCSGAADANYTISYGTGSVTVDKAPLTVTASSPAMTYGGTVPAITAGYAGFVNGDSASSLSAKPTCSTTATGSDPVSPPTYPSSCSGAADPNYTIGYAGGSVTINQAPLTITASSASMTYGGTVAGIIPSYSGFVNGDGPGSLSTAPTCTTTATSSSPASPPAYTSSCSGASDANYTISYGTGSVTIRKAPLSVTASSGSMAYGGAVPAIAPSYSGFVNGDGPGSLSTAPTCTTTATSSSPVSGSPYLSSCAGAVDANYSFSYPTGSVTVGPVPLTITASSPTTPYGSAATIAPGYSGFVNGDTGSSLTTKPVCTTTATKSSPVSGSPYASSCSGAVDPNYVIAYVTGSVTVNPAPLTITASSGTMTYGSTPPAVTASYAGFANGDSAASLSPPPTCSTLAASTSPVSPPTYASSCNGAADPNYSFSYDEGAVTVNPAPIPVAVSGSQADMAAPSFSATDSPPAGVTVDTTGLTCSEVAPSTTITGNLPSGSYTLVASSCAGAQPTGNDAPDYEVVITSASGDFTVTGGPTQSNPSTPPPPTAPVTHGYWLVGSDGGIFTFGSASFYGSTGSLKLQRPVVGITPTKDRGGYWLVASDGGTFAFGDAGFYGSIPGLGLNPAGSGLPHSLNAPIVGMVPAADGQGYFVVASDGGVFAFGPGASFAGSCPGIGGCSGPAVAVIPDSSGSGYWLFTATGNVYTFGDAPYLGAPGGVGSPVTSAVRTPDGRGYWVLVANGTVYGFGDAVNYGSPGGQLGGLNPATAVFTTSDGGGYWVVSAAGAVDPYGDAPNDGGMAGTKLNGAIIAATGF